MIKWKQWGDHLPSREPGNTPQGRDLSGAPRHAPMQQQVQGVHAGNSLAARAEEMRYSGCCVGRDLHQLQTHHLTLSSLKAELSSPMPSCEEPRQGTAAHPNSFASSQLQLKPWGLCAPTPSPNTPHNQAQTLVSPHPDCCTFPLVFLHRADTALPQQVTGSGRPAHALTTLTAASKGWA